MTIAACYLSPEGVVFGADSTTTVTLGPGGSGGTRYYEYAQKIFPVGVSSSLGLVTWGLGGLPVRSHRALIAQFADSLRASPPLPSMAAVAQRWSEFFWEVYSQALTAEISRAQTLLGLPQRSAAEEVELIDLLQGYTIGFCFGGNLDHDRTPCAFEVIFSPDRQTAPVPEPLSVGELRYWGCPNIMERMVFGIDPRVYEAILQSGRWNGTAQDLLNAVQPHILQTISVLPIREAIDWVHASVYATIKMTRYSQLEPLCGSAGEIAVITADFPFQWVRHKALGAAINPTGE